MSAIDRPGQGRDEIEELGPRLRAAQEALDNVRGDVDAISAGLPVRAVIYYVGEQPMLGFEAAK